MLFDADGFTRFQIRREVDSMTKKTGNLICKPCIASALLTSQGLCPVDPGQPYGA